MDPPPPTVAKHWSTDTYSVRERFGMGVILLATAYVAVYFAVCQATDMPWIFTAFFAGLAAWVMLAQIVWCRWEEPRLVSAFAGGAYFAVWLVYMVIDDGGPYGLLLGWLPLAALLGLLPGYVAGGLVASVFLIHDFFRQAFGARRREREALRAAMGETPSESPFDD